MLRFLQFSLRFFSAVIAIAGLLAVIGLATMPTSDVGDLRLLPSEISIYLDTNDELRNILGGAALQTGLLTVAITWIPSRRWLAAFGICAALSFGVFAAAETVQLFLPERTFDPGDIVNGAIGVSVVTLLFLPALLARAGNQRHVNEGNSKFPA